jgi:AcrR family transcriptional regulator
MRIQTQYVYDVNMKNTSPASKAGYHHGRLREALIESGLSLLASGGLAELSLRALARQVGVSANAAYRHFESKDALLNAMASEGFRRLAAAQHQAIWGQPDVMKQLMVSGRAYIDFAMSQPALFRLMFDRATRHPDDAELQASRSQAMTVLLACASSMTQAPVDDERTKVSAAAAWGLVHGLSDLAMGGQLAALGMDPLQLVERVMSLPVEAMMPGSATGTTPGCPPG